MVCNQGTMTFYSPITSMCLTVDSWKSRISMRTLLVVICMTLFQVYSTVGRGWSGSGLVHLHKVVHRDIKPENLLLTNDDHVKISIHFRILLPSLHIGDFGVAHLFETCSNAEQSIMSQLPETTKPLHLLTRTATGLLNNTEGTMYFYPPESTMEQPYNTYAADVHSRWSSH